MPLFDRILFAADFSERSRDAFRVACSLADETGTRVVVLHVVEQSYIVEQVVAFGNEGIPVPLPDGGWAHDEALNAQLRRFYAPARPADIEYRVREGSAAEEILGTADEVRPDLIALGTQGKTGLRRMLFGSVAESVLRKARCAVLALSAPGIAPGASPPRVILHPTDFSDRSEPALRVARALAREHGALLIVIHVVPVEFASETVTLPAVTPDDHENLHRVRSRADGPDLKYPVEGRMMRGDVATTILRAADEEECGLIVMGTHGRNGFGRLLMGSVTEAVLRKAHCPVLAVKSETPPGTAAPPPDDSVAAVGGVVR